MKLLRFGPLGQEKPGPLDPDGNIRDLSGVISDFDARTLSPEGLSELAGDRSEPPVHRERQAPASGGAEYIETVWGRGYLLREPQCFREAG